MTPARRLLPCSVLLLTGASLGCNSQHTSTFKMNLFTERAQQPSGPRTNFRLDSIGGLAAPTISRHAHSIPMTAAGTHHHLHGAI